MCNEYENAIVTFIDILGFRNIVTRSSCSEVASLLNAVERVTSPDAPLPDGTPCAYNPIVYAFSDSIIRIRPVETEENRNCRIGLLFLELLDLVYIQSELVKHDVLLRGAVSFGRICSTNDRVYGPALIRAYELETNCAIHPRIIVDPDLLIEVRNNPLLRNEDNSLADERESIAELLRKGDDSFWFVDYLRARNQKSMNLKCISTAIGPLH